MERNEFETSLKYTHYDHSALTERAPALPPPFHREDAGQGSPGLLATSPCPAGRQDLPTPLPTLLRKQERPTQMSAPTPVADLAVCHGRPFAQMRTGKGRVRGVHGRHGLRSVPMFFVLLTLTRYKLHTNSCTVIC